MSDAGVPHPGGLLGAEAGRKQAVLMLAPSLPLAQGGGSEPEGKILSRRPKQRTDARGPRAEQSLCTCVRARAAPRTCVRARCLARRWSSRGADSPGGRSEQEVGRGRGACLMMGLCLRGEGSGDVTAAPGRANAPCTRGAHVAAWQGCGRPRRWRGGAPGWGVSLRPGRCVLSLALPLSPALGAGAF